MLIYLCGVCSTTKTTPLSLGETSRRALSVPLTSDNGQRKHSRLANIQQFDASALDHPDTNLTGVDTSSNIGNLSNPSGVYVIMIHSVL